MWFRHILFLIALFACACGSSASSVKYGFFDHYTTKNGLVSNRVFSMDQDENGFIWIGTDFGLERFDGQFFKHHRKKEYTNVSREDFLFVHALQSGRIAAGGYAGLYVEYDPQADSFQDRRHTDDGKTIIQETMNVYSHQGNQYLYTGAGVYTFDAETDSYSERNDLYRATQKRFVRAMHIDSKGRYWLGSMDSMMVFDSVGERVYGFVPQGDACSFVRTMVSLNDSLLIVAGQTSEVWVFNTSKDRIADPRIISTPFDCITNIVQDDDGRFWIATDAHGLWYTDDFLSSHPQFINLIPFNASTDEVRKIYCLMKDKKGDIWFGTQSSGIWHYRKQDDTGITCSWNFGFPSVVCSSFAEDSNGDLIVGVDGGGLYSVNKNYQQKPIAKFPNNNVSGMTNWHANTCYIASWGGGLYRFDLNTGNYERERFDGIHAPSNCFFDVKSIDDGSLIACSAGDGVYRKFWNSNTWERIMLYDSISNSDDNWILSVCGGGKNALWILTTNTLWYEEKDQYMSFSHTLADSLDPLGIIDIISDGENGLLAITNQGVLHYTKNVKEPEILDFLPKSYYRTITRDDNGRYWLAGDDGILSFDYGSKECHKLPENYIDTKSFLFHPRSSYKAKNGMLYFGTNEGFICIDPNKLSFDMIIPYLAFSQLNVRGKKCASLSNPSSETPSLQLKYGETDIVIDIDVIDYSSADRVQCEYRLIGLQDEWKPIQYDRKVKFSYIPTGEYVLEVKAFRTNESCEAKIIKLPILVSPPWWKTWWFYGLMIILLMLAVFALFKWRMRSLIDQKNRLNEQVSLRTIELQNALKDKDSLISVIGHDLKNPMFAIVVALDNLLNKESSLNEENRHSLISDIRDSAKTLQGEMLKLLDWAQSKNDELVCKPQDFDLTPLVDDAIQLTSSLLKGKEIVCKKDISLERKVYADPRMISAVIRNLLGNAVKFTQPGGEITIGASQNEELVTIYVQDTGVGMSNETISDLLSGKRLKSTDGTEKERGTGLGLSMCRKYVDLNNGTFSVNSKEGEGTCITFTIPAAESKVVIESETKNPVIVQNEGAGECLEGNVILVVDDNPLICENMKILLADFCQVIVAHNGQQAIDMVKESDVDLILSDVDMPVMNGIKMCSQLQHDETFSHIPILFISGRNDERDRLAGLVNGAIDYIAKPFSQEELMAKLRSIFKLRKQEQTYLLAKLMKGNSEEESCEEQPVEDPFVASFMTLVRERYTESELSVDDLADILCVSRATMFRRVKTLVGKSPLEVLNDYRLNEAMRLLKKQGTSSVADVAYSVGFSDPSYFSKRFKAYFGMSPTQVKA